MELIQTENLTAKFSEKRDVIVLVLGASRTDGEHITDAQVGSALNTAKSVLQLVGADVDAASSAFLLPDSTFSEGDSLTAKTTVELWKDVPEGEAAPNGELDDGEPAEPVEETEETDDNVELGEIDEAE